MSDARIVNLRFGEKQPPQSRQILDIHKARTRDFRSGEIKFLKILKSSEMNQVGISEPAFAEIDADNSLLIVKCDPCAKFLEFVNLLGEGRIDLGHGGIHEFPHPLRRPI